MAHAQRPNRLLRFTVDEFASILRALPPADPAGVTFPPGDPTSSHDGWRDVATRPLGEAEPRGCGGAIRLIYIVHLAGHFNPGGDGDRHFIGVNQGRLFAAIRQRHLSADHP